jgi:SAM-dependent methyltransferase
MTVTFGQYASYYDSLYAAKDYGRECEFLEAMFTRYAKHPVRTVLDLGCGTGGHSVVLSERGFEVLGVDRSAEMLAVATRRRSKAEFAQGDIATFASGRTFDAAVCMFAVLSYLDTDAQLESFFNNVSAQLLPGGIFVCDFWHGPGVLTDPPGDRLKTLSRPDGEVLRFAQTELIPDKNVGIVRYRVIHLDGSRVVSDIEEAHTMRYFFAPELEGFGRRSGLKMELFCDLFHAEKSADTSSWCASAVFMKEAP